MDLKIVAKIPLTNQVQIQINGKTMFFKMPPSKGLYQMTDEEIRYEIIQHLHNTGK